MALKDFGAPLKSFGTTLKDFGAAEGVAKARTVWRLRRAVLAMRLIGIGIAVLGGIFFVVSFRKLLALRPRKPRLQGRDPFDPS